MRFLVLTAFVTLGLFGAMTVLASIAQTNRARDRSKVDEERTTEAVIAVYYAVLGFGLMLFASLWLVVIA